MGEAPKQLSARPMLSRGQYSVNKKFVVRTGPQINILLLRDGTDGREAMVDWLGSDDDRPMQCLIDFTRFLRF